MRIAAGGLSISMRPNRPSTRILGLDPGLRRTGWGVLESAGNSLSFIACGSVQTDEKAPLASRLAALHAGLAAVLARYAPEEAAVEETFVNADSRGALKLGQARGIALLVPAQAGLLVAEYAPNLVKKSVVGAGRAEKTQVRMMIGVLLPKAQPETHDACDALAIAICHAHHRGTPALRIAAGAAR
jgi:crossover junction endodeoxyribonuclease RuvC